MRRAMHLLITRLSRISNCFARLALPWRDGQVYTDLSLSRCAFREGGRAPRGPDRVGLGYMPLAQQLDRRAGRPVTARGRRQR